MKAASCCLSLTLKGPWSEAETLFVEHWASFILPSLHTMLAIYSVFLKSGSLEFLPSWADCFCLRRNLAWLFYVSGIPSAELCLTLFKGSPIQMLFRGQQGDSVTEQRG